MGDTLSAKKIGEIGENISARYLEKRGYTILERNYRCPYGEIDIIASDGEYIVFAEVKTRSLSAFSRPAAAVDIRKQKKLIRTAMIYLSGSEAQLTPRFDVIEVVRDDSTGSVVDINHIKDAFILQEDPGQYFKGYY